jgi:uncharacterized damage-inducible protein DinB
MTGDTADLAKSALIKELEQLHDAIVELVKPLSDKQLWQKPLEPGNSIGHLVLHLTGNLNHFIGGQLGKTGYLRDREREFTETRLPDRATLLAKLDSAVTTFGQVVGGLSATELAAPHPETRFGPVYHALVHLVAHFALHRGQMTYIARLTAK